MSRVSNNVDILLILEFNAKKIVFYIDTLGDRHYN